MNSLSDKRWDPVLAGIGLLFALPAIYFFTGSFLKYEMHLFAHVEIWAPPPWVMIGGLLLAIFINLYSLFRFNEPDKLGTLFLNRIKTRPWNALIISISILFMSLLFAYVLLENLAENTAV